MDCADCCLQKSSGPPHSLRSDLLPQKAVFFLSCLSIEVVIEKESEKSLSIINWKTLREF